jgi:cellulose synthase/poly-beta-1,6-N-acetylglucosamine synthase-like glycosyltransferase
MVLFLHNEAELTIGINQKIKIITQLNMTCMPKITVLLPVYNCELYVQTAVESILNQTYTDFELLIIDDSTRLMQLLL